MLMGTADPVPVAPAKPTVFVEDLPDAQKDAGVRHRPAPRCRCEFFLTAFGH